MIKKILAFMIMSLLMGASVAAQTDDATPIIINRATTFDLEPGGSHTVSFDVEAETDYSIEVISDDFDAFASLRFADGALFVIRGTRYSSYEDDNDGIGGSNTLMNISVFSQDRPMLLNISSRDGSGGTFTVIVSRITSDVYVDVTETNYGVNNAAQCNYTLSRRFIAGDEGRLQYGYDPVRIRNYPGLGSQIRGVLANGSLNHFRVVAEPDDTDGFTGTECRDGYYWVFIERTDGLRGWVAAGRDGNYWLEITN